MSVEAALAITVNGEPREVPKGATVSDLIRQLNLNPQLVAVEIDRELVRKARFSERLLASGDQVEIVEFVGGG